MRTSKFAYIVEKSICLIIGILIFLMPFFRGTFFEREIMKAELVINILFLVWIVLKIIKRERVFQKTYLTLGVFILVIAYLLPLIFGYSADFTSAYGYFFRYVSVFELFLIVGDYAKENCNIKIWLYSIVLSGVFISFLALDALAGGTINNLLGFSNTGYMWNRLIGTLQYSNTTGMYLAMTSFVAVALITLTPQRPVKLFLSAVVFVTFTGVLLTLSRGVILVFIVVYIILFFLLKYKEDKIEMIIWTVLPLISSAVTYIFLSRVFSYIDYTTGVIINQELLGELSLKVFGYTAIGLVIASLVTYLLSFMEGIFKKISLRIYIVIFAFALLLFVVLGIGFVYTMGIENILSNDFIKRFISNADVTSERMNFYTDGIKILKDTWLLGSGGGAWSALYRVYQSYDYSSTEAHNFLLQCWLETGILGVGAFLLILFSTVRSYFINRRLKEGKRTIAIIGVVLFILIHACIDFDLSYFSVECVLFMLLAILNTVDSKVSHAVPVKEKNKGFWLSIIVASLGVIVFITNTCIIISRQYAKNATQVLLQDNLTEDVLEQSENYLNKAKQFNSWDNKIYFLEFISDKDRQISFVTLYDMVMTSGQADDTVKKLYYHNLLEAEKLQPKNPVIKSKIGIFLIFEAGEFDTGIEYLKKGLEYNQMSATRYEELAICYYKIGEYYTQKGQADIAKQYFEELVSLETKVNEHNESSIKKISLNEQTLTYIEQAKEIQ